MSSVLFVTGNQGKFRTAKLMLGDLVPLEQRSLDTPEEEETVREVVHTKVTAAYNHFKSPVLVDDSGFVIPSLGGWPGARVARVLRGRDGKEDLSPFIEKAKESPREAYWEMVLAYLDAELEEPKFFTSYVHGHLIGEARGNWDTPSPAMKSRLWYCFIPRDSTKTLAEMTDEERARTLTDYWPEARDFFSRNRPKLTFALERQKSARV